MVWKKLKIIIDKICCRFRSTNEVREIHRKQMDDIETRLSNAKHNEQILNNELGQIKNQFILEQNDWQKDKCRADALEKQLNEIQQMINHKEVVFFYFFLPPWQISDLIILKSIHFARNVK